MNHDSKDNGNENRAEEESLLAAKDATSKLNNKLGGSEHTNKIVLNRRAKVILWFIATSIFLVFVATIVYVSEGPEWLTITLSVVSFMTLLAGLVIPYKR